MFTNLYVGSTIKANFATQDVSQWYTLVWDGSMETDPGTHELAFQVYGASKEESAERAIYLCELHNIRVDEVARDAREIMKTPVQRALDKAKAVVGYLQMAHDIDQAVATARTENPELHKITSDQFYHILSHLGKSGLDISDD